MTEIIDFDQARTRLGPRAEARRAARQTDREARAAEERRHWLRELETWPAPFRRTLRDFVLRGTTAESFDEGGAWSPGARWWDLCHAAADGGPDDVSPSGSRFDTYVDALRRALRGVRTAAASLRDAKRERRPRLIANRRVALAKEKLGVLETLWTYGRQRVDRAELEPFARRELEEDAERVRERLPLYDRELDQARAVLALGRYQLGRRKGEPLTPAYVVLLERRLVLMAERRARDEAWLAAQRGADPLRGWGLRWSRRAEARP